jgi:hypothetical protein
MDTFRSIIVSTGGKPFALPAGPSSDLVLLNHAKQIGSIDRSLCVILGFEQPVAMATLMQALPTFGLRPGQTMASLGPTGSNMGLARLWLVDQGASDVRRLADLIASTLGNAKKSQWASPTEEQIEAQIESWDIEWSLAQRGAHLASKSAPRI